MKNTILPFLIILIIAFNDHQSNCQIHLWGMTEQGGDFDAGVIFEFDPINITYNKKFDFDGDTLGKSPEGSLLLASNGKFYGVTREGGLFHHGVLFEFNPIDSTYTKILDFKYDSTGRYPTGTLFQHPNGKIYGTTSEAYKSGGNIFELDPNTNSYEKKIDFDVLNGSNPTGDYFIISSNGELYGLTKEGGNSGCQGVLYKYNPTTNILTKLVDFDLNSSMGNTPYGGLLLHTNGKLYGTTNSSGYGVIFEYNIEDSIYTKIHDFDLNSGANPTNGLIEASNNKIYGTTQSGGLYWNGVLFEYDPASGIYTKKYEFHNALWPQGRLMQASNGLIYGMTTLGGEYAGGLIYEFNPSDGIFNVKYNFQQSTGFLPVYTFLIEYEIKSAVEETNEPEELISVYPNPASSNFIINFPNRNQKGYSLHFYDLSGNIIFQKSNISDNKIELERNNIRPGLYFIELRGPNVYRGKIVIE
jgi:hypothetical protein